VQLDDTGKPAPRLQPEDGRPPRIPLRPSLLSKLADKGEVIVERIDQLTVRMNQMLSDENQRRFSSALDNMGTAAADAGKLARRLDATVGSRVDPALAAVQKSADQVGRTAADFSRTAADFSQTARRLNEKDGPIDRLAAGTEALSHAADSFNSATLPRINRVTEETSRAVRQLARAANTINDNPQSLIFGSGAIAPGPGEPGFTAPEASQ